MLIKFVHFTMRNPVLYKSISVNNLSHSFTTSPHLTKSIMLFMYSATQISDNMSQFTHFCNKNKNIIIDPT
jgi:hypothetical protein